MWTKRCLIIISGQFPLRILIKKKFPLRIDKYIWADLMRSWLLQSIIYHNYDIVLGHNYLVLTTWIKFDYNEKTEPVFGRGSTLLDNQPEWSLIWITWSTTCYGVSKGVSFSLSFPKFNYFSGIFFMQGWSIVTFWRRKFSFADNHDLARDRRI